jgi:hypothetical protein
MKTIPITIKSSTDEKRVRNYLSMLYNLHKLTEKEVDIIVEFILRYYDIIAKYPVHDDELISKMLFDPSVKKKIKDKYNMKDTVLQNYMTVFRKKGVIKGNMINKSYIPPKESFELVFKFI